MSKKIFNILCWIWLGCIGVTLFYSSESIVKLIFGETYHARLIMLVIGCAFLILYFFFANVIPSKARVISLFVLAFLVRLIFISLQLYIPTNDFANYYYGAVWFGEYGFERQMYEGLEIYKMPSYAGMSIINGILMKIFAPTLFGMQIINNIYTSGICCFIYLMGKKISERGALIGALLYAIYPISIISTAVTTNHHGATFFLLLGILEWSQISEKKRRNIFFCVVCFVLSNFYHPSTALTFLGLLLFSFIEDLGNKKISIKDIFMRTDGQIKTRTKSLAIFGKGYFAKTKCTIFVIICYFFVWNILMSSIINSGYVKNTSTVSVLRKFVVGCNFETIGRTSQADQEMLRSFPEDEYNSKCIEEISERLKEHSVLEIVELLIQKNSNTWFNNDDYSWFLLYEKNLLLDKEIEEVQDVNLKVALEKEKYDLTILYHDMVLSDTMFVVIIWLLALIGILSLMHNGKTNIIYLYLFIPMGWMAFIMLTEQQARYRYQGMTIIIMMAGMGMDYLITKIKRYKSC